MISEQAKEEFKRIAEELIKAGRIDMNALIEHMQKENVEKDVA